MPAVVGRRGGLSLVRPRVGLGRGPNWVTFSPDGAYCCVSNVLGDDVSVIDVARRQEVARVPVGKQPKRLVVVNAP